MLEPKLYNMLELKIYKMYVLKHNIQYVLCWSRFISKMRAQKTWRIGISGIISRTWWAWGLGPGIKKLTSLLPLLNTSHNKSLYTADTVLGETLSILVFFIYQTPLRPLVNSLKICFRFRRNIQLHCLKIRLCFLWWVGMMRIEKKLVQQISFLVLEQLLVESCFWFHNVFLLFLKHAKMIQNLNILWEKSKENLLVTTYSKLLAYRNWDVCVKAQTIYKNTLSLLF